VHTKLQQFVAQTMGMALLNVAKTEALQLCGASGGGAFAHMDTLTRTPRGSLHHVYEFKPEKWIKRNMRYMTGARKYMPGVVARDLGVITLCV